MGYQVKILAPTGAYTPEGQLIKEWVPDGDIFDLEKDATDRARDYRLRNIQAKVVEVTATIEIDRASFELH